MKVPGLDPLPPSTKKVWRLKKYTKSSSEIQQEQQEYADLEFSPKKSTRRPKNRPGEQQEFVFVDLSPRKKNNKEVAAPSRASSAAQVNELQMPILSASPDVTTASSSSSTSSLSSTSTEASTLEPSSKRHGLSRLFRLSSQQQPAKQQVLLDSPQLPPLQTVDVGERPGRPAFSSRASSPLSLPPQPPQLKRTTTPQLVMCVSSDGRAVLQPSSASSSTTDLFSLNSQHHNRSPSPKREAESPLPFADSTDDETQDACRAFERAVRRKRANTAGSIHSLTRNLSRTHSVSSMSSFYRGGGSGGNGGNNSGHARMSPSRAAMLRQTTPVESRPPPMEDFVGSFFDDSSREGRRPMGHLRAQRSISTLGPALGMTELETFDGDLTITKSINNIDAGGDGDHDGVAEPVDDNLAQFFDFSAFGDEQFHLQDI